MDIHIENIKKYLKDCISNIEDLTLYVSIEGKSEEITFKRWLTHVLIGPLSELSGRIDYLYIKINLNQKLLSNDLKLLDDLYVSVKTIFAFLRSMTKKRNIYFKVDNCEGNMNNPLPYAKLNRVFYDKIFIKSRNKLKNWAIVKDCSEKINLELIELEKVIMKIFY